MNNHSNSFYTYHDSLPGSIAAFEGIRGGVAILNSPTGCKFASSFFVESQDPGGSGVAPLEYNEKHLEPNI